jgi:rod shape-determining protein MreD
MRNAAFLATGILLILIQANLYRVLGFIHLNGASPSLVLPLIIFLGVHEHSMSRGAILAFTLGYFLDIVASAPMWLFTFVSVAIFWLSRIAGVRLTAQTVLTRAALGFGFSIVESATVLILLAVFGSDTRRPLELVQIILPHAVATALFAPIVFRIAQKLHQSTQGVQHGAAESAAR